jgi:hypothetical protein
MKTAAATVIDFEAYRARKLQQQREAAGGPLPGNFFPAGPIAWMPVWFVPVYYPVGALSAGTASG